ncbi:MAG: hypothetical protein WC593_15015 [Methanoregula sp.]
MSSPVLSPRFKWWDSNNIPLSGGVLYTYAAGTDTPTPTYADPLFATSNGNFVTLDANGEALIYSKTILKLLLKDADGVTVDGFPIDNVEFPPYHSYILLGPTVPATPSANVVALYASGTSIYTKDSAGTIGTFITSSGIQQQSYTAASAGGSANAITATFTPSIPALTDKLRVSVLSTAANTGAVTFAPDSLLAKPVISYSGAPLVGNQIPAANYPLDLQYVQALDSWVLLNRGTYGSIGRIAVLQNRQAQNVAGGTATQGSWLIVPINTEQEDNHSIVDSSALPAFSLNAGTYLIEASCPFVSTALSQIRLYNVTDAAVVASLIGKSAKSASADSIDSTAKGIVTITATKQFRLEYQVGSTAATYGLGIAANFGVEVYAQIMITQIA